MHVAAHWYAQLAGSTDDMQAVVSLGSVSDLHFVEIDDFACVEFLNLAYDTPASTVRGLADDVLQMVRGLLRLYTHKPARLFVRALFRREIASAPSQYVLAVGFRNQSSFGVAAASSDGEQLIPIVAPERVALEAGAADDSIAKILRLLGTGDCSFRQMYVVYETIEGALGGMKKLVSSGLATERNVRRFKHTANSVAILGDAARHGKDTTTPPTDPMPLNEATGFIEDLARRYIALSGRRPTRR